MTPKIERFLAEARPSAPFLVVDLDVVADRFLRLREQMPLASVYYAVKANPAPEILRLLCGLGASFDAAGVEEVEMCLAVGASPERISYGNTIKKERDIARAHALGVRMFAFDSEAELEKITRAAPASRVFCRIQVQTGGADWPLAGKFGCHPDMAEALLIKAKDLGLDAYGVSFHVGSQQMDPEQWDTAIAAAAETFRRLDDRGVALGMVNLGGGLPARYRDEVMPLAEYARAISDAMTRHFGNRLPAMVLEPGRFIVGDAGLLESEVVLVARKKQGDARRWVYLDVGRFNGLAETMDEAIRYRVRTSRDGAAGGSGPVVLAGPTCDSVDVIYDDADYHLPLALEAGDRIQFLSTGAYTSTYASVGFNGFAPLRSYYV